MKKTFRPCARNAADLILPYQIASFHIPQGDATVVCVQSNTSACGECRYEATKITKFSPVDTLSRADAPQFHVIPVASTQDCGACRAEGGRDQIAYMIEIERASLQRVHPP